MTAIESQVYYLLHIDLQERDPLTGKPIFKVKDIMAEVTQLSKVIDELQTLEDHVKKSITAQSELRAGATEGFIPKGL